MSYRLTPIKGSGWHRLGLLAALGFLPVTAMLWATDSFGGGKVGITSAVIFYGAGLVLSALLAFGMAWAMKGFAVRTHGEDDAEDHGARRDGPAAHHPAPAAAHPPAAKGHAPAAGHK